MSIRTPVSSYTSEPFFNQEEENNEKNNYYNDLWRKSIEDRQNRPLTIQEYEHWYEIAANTEMNSELQYVNYVRGYNENYNGSKLLENGKHYHDEPEKTLAMPSLMCTEEQLFSKLSLVTRQYNTLKEENEQCKNMLNNYQNNYAHSPDRQALRVSPECYERPVKQGNQKRVKFLHGPPKNLFPVKSERIVKQSRVHDSVINPRRIERIHSYRYVQEKVTTESPATFFKASELIKKLDNPQSSIIAETGESINHQND